MIDFFKKHDIFPVTAAVLAAILLWVYVITTQNPEITVSRVVSLQVEGQKELADAGLSIINELPKTVTVQLKGRRDLVAALTDEKITATMNVASVFKSGDYKMGYTVKVDIDSISVVQKTPSQVSLTIDQMTQMEIPVEVHQTGQLPQGLELKSVGPQSDTVLVSGPLRSLEKIQKAITVLDLSTVNQSGAVMSTLKLVDDQEEEIKDTYLTYNNEVGIEVALHSVGTANLTVEVLPTELITKDMISIDIQPKSIQLKGAKDKIAATTEIKLGTIDIAKAVDTKAYQYTFAIPLPEGVTVEGNVHQAIVTVAVKGFVEKTVEIPQTAFEPLEGFTYLTEGLSITLLISEEDAAKITPEDISLVLLEGVTEPDPTQTHRIEVEIRCEAYKIIPIGKYFIEVMNTQ